MNIKEFKEWLNQFDDDVIVKVLVQKEAPMYESYGEAVQTEFTGEKWEDHDHVDFRGNRFTKPHEPHYNKKYLILGGKA